MALLLQENGDAVLLEGGVDRLLLEGEFVAVTTVSPITVAYREATEQRHRLIWRDNR